MPVLFLLCHILLYTGHVIFHYSTGGTKLAKVPPGQYVGMSVCYLYLGYCHDGSVKIFSFAYLFPMVGTQMVLLWCVLIVRYIRIQEEQQFRFLSYNI